MASELLSLLLWANATLSVGILIVFVLRVPVRRFAGSRVAYALWLLPLLAFLAWLAPARQVTVPVALPSVFETAGGAMADDGSGLLALLMIAGWLAGVGGMIAMFALRQRGFVRSAGSLEPVAALGRSVFTGAPSHGPAVVGALRPIIVLPRDFDERFSAEEQALVLAHERAHLDRFDPMVNAAAMGLRAVNWFNPLVHIAAQALRIDQELACDAAVLARHSGAQRAYAEAMLKSHAAAFEVPVGCAWHTAAFHPLKERILMLTSSPSRLSRGLGLSLVAAAAFAVCGAVWLMRPVEVLAAPAKEEPMSAAEEEALRDAEIDARDAEIDAREAEREAQQAAQDALRDAHAALASAQRDAELGAREAAKEAHAALAAARMALKDAAPALAAAREAMKEVRPAIAAAQQAIREAQPEIAAAGREAARHVRLARLDALRAEARALAVACKRTLARWPSFDATSQEDLRALEKLVCIPRGAERPVQAPTPVPEPQD
jgi:beta-lactamase regulating signal transducer with metallopeptidase domain